MGGARRPGCPVGGIRLKHRGWNILNSVDILDPLKSVEFFASDIDEALLSCKIRNGSVDPMRYLLILMGILV